MSAQDAYDQCLLRWNDEVAYAQTLRDRRKLFTNALIVIAGLGALRIELFAPADEVASISNGWLRALVMLLLFASITSLCIGAYLIFRSAHKKNDEAPKRASKELELTAFQVKMMSIVPRHLDPSLEARAEQLRCATLLLADRNRVISENIGKGAFAISLGITLIVVAAGVYSLCRGWQ